MTNDQKNQLKYYCNICDCLCFSQLYYNKHIDSTAHKIKTTEPEKEILINDNIDSNIKKYIDECFLKLISKLKITIEN
jgi:hypothetical protein